MSALIICKFGLTLTTLRYNMFFVRVFFFSCTYVVLQRPRAGSQTAIIRGSQQHVAGIKVCEFFILKVKRKVKCYCLLVQCSIPMTRYYRDLGSFSDWLKKIPHVAKPMNVLCLFLRHHFTRKPVMLQNVSCFPILSGSPNTWLIPVRIIQTKLNSTRVFC